MSGIRAGGWGWAAAVLGAAVLLAVPVLPAGADVYAHLLWTHQAMRCLAGGELPLWAPDLDAGFGSPGIRLYSPAGPVLAAVLGLPAADAALGLRAALLVAVAALVLVARRRAGNRWAAALILLGTPALADLTVRGAWSQVLALPVELALLEGAVRDGTGRRARWRGEALLLALLWLVHAPSAVMVAALLLLAAAVGPEPGRALAARGGALAVAGALTAWHWLPLSDELRLTRGRQGLTAGIFDAARNWLGSPVAHAPRLNLALSAAAVAMGIVGIAVFRSLPPRERLSRLVLLAACLALAGPPVLLALELGLPLDWLQFPWRWLTPAALVVAGPLAARLRRRPAWLALWLAPALLLPWVRPFAAPRLGPRQGWPEVGAAVASFGGNPLAVDVVEHRPPWYDALGTELVRFGPRARVVTEPTAWRRVTVWRPLLREVEVVAGMPAVIRLRLLRYPGWEIAVDGRPVPPLSGGAAVAVRVQPGHHRVRARWRGNPLARVGQALAAAALAALWLAPRWRRRPSVRG